jgi:putative ABC transport system permease protein
MEALFVERLAEAKTRRERARVWRQAGLDVLRRAPAERWRRSQPSTGGGLMATAARDIRFALRAFVRQPGATALVLLTLTLGIGATTAVFSLLDGLFLRPFPFREPDRLMYLDETAPKWNLDYTGIFYGDFVAWREHTRAFEGMALLDTEGANVWDGSTSERLDVTRTTYDFPAVLGVAPLLGRTFAAEEDRPAGAAVVLLSEGYWRRRFAGARDVVGRSLTIDGVAHTVVGVMPQAAEFPDRTDLWLPLAKDPAMPCCSYSYRGIGRLRPGVSLTQARADLAEAQKPLWAAHDTEHVVSPVMLPLRDHLVADYRVIGMALGVGVALVLLIACANVASVMLARAIFRQREIGIRSALGATAGQVTRQLLTESLVLSVAAGLLGTGLGRWALHRLVAGLPDRLPGWASFAVDWRAGVFALLIVGVTAVLFGLAPAVQARHQDGSHALIVGSRGGSPTAPQRRTLNALVVGEIALASVLLIGGGLLLRAYQAVAGADPGYRVDHVLSFRLAPPSSTYPDGSDHLVLYDRIMASLRALPDVESVGAINCPPLGCHLGQLYRGEGQAEAPDGHNPVVLTRLASPDYFATMGIRLLRGRLLRPGDGAPGTRPAVVVNESFAKLKWPDLPDPTGRWIGSGSDTTNRMTVVGVVADVRHYGLDRPARPGVYLPMGIMAGQTDPPAFSIVLRTRRNPTTALEPVRAVMSRIDPTLALYQVGTMTEAVERSLGLRRTFSWLLAVFAGIALALAVGGVYAVLSYLVGRRTRELGIRITLGAERRQVLGLVLRQGVVLVGIGLAIGLPAALLAGRGLTSLLVGVSANDPATFLVVAGALLVTGLLAALVPARRASAVDPRVALTDE